MRKLILVVVAVAVLAGCRMGEMSPEEKQKVTTLRSEIEKVEKDIAATEKELSLGTKGIIPALKQSRVEADKLTVSILRQHIAAIESGSKVTISAPATNPDPALAASLEAEMKDMDISIHKTRAESSLYRGGLVKAMIDSRAATQELTLATLKQRYLAAKYGLSIAAPKPQPSVSNNVADKEIQPPQDAQAEAPKQEEVNDPGPFDFRSVRWGMSKAEVLQREKSKPANENEETILYDEEIFGHKATLMYSFTDGKLYSAGYILDNKQYSNKNKYVDAYNEIVDSLTEKYGKPTEKKDIWSRDLYKNNYQERGMAYSAGHVTSRARWEKDNESIKAVIMGNNYEITCGIIYDNKMLAKEVDKTKKKKQSSKL